MTPIVTHAISSEELMHQALQIHRRDERNRKSHKKGNHGSGDMSSPHRVPTCPMCKPDREPPAVSQ